MILSLDQSKFNFHRKVDREFEMSLLWWGGLKSAKPLSLDRMSHLLIYRRLVLY